ncbi:hypothetical protein Terro_2840 [Terriglobus roseus DSM 18391]|uniref:Uncharacterized protein n=1 Tax=Terriglobus roseus (strain DSM 18391 / NRRL B-41598 / KBS 63) TaxID=926566 RepID=I3ZIK8_TERRK|nr:CYCXC family (seleno)protein [Terriglobus roseus]AFL89076.1 hypothetical protein Terro_2840 [Terriglobus roseus DSM 18391]
MRFSKDHIYRGFGVASLALLTLAATAQWAKPDIPAYHANPSRSPMPKLFADAERNGVYFSRPYQTASYKMADAIPEVLYQMPCYCRCDRAMGHKSLHSCFEGSHAAVCTTCMSEAAYAYQQHRAGKTIAQIRSGIERGDWQEVDLAAVNDEMLEPLQP